MANKRHKPEEIVTKLRQVDVLVGQSIVCAGPCLSATPYSNAGALRRIRLHVPGEFIGIGWKGTRVRRVASKICGMECGMA
jgi:hypothetical protein